MRRTLVAPLKDDCFKTLNPQVRTKKSLSQNIYSKAEIICVKSLILNSIYSMLDFR